MSGIEPGELVLGGDNGSAFTARRFRARLAELGIKHLRGGYRDPESQVFIGSWFGSGGSDGAVSRARTGTRTSWPRKLTVEATGGDHRR